MNKIEVVLKLHISFGDHCALSNIAIFVSYLQAEVSP